MINFTNNAFLHAFDGRTALVTECNTFFDNGADMSEATQARLFQPFFSTKIGQFGTGLGMTIVGNLVRRLGGVLTVQSMLNGGTTFSIEFPATAPDATV